MLLSAPTTMFHPYFSCEETIELMSQAGFDAMDFSFSDSEEFYGEETDSEAFKERFLRLKAIAEEKNMCFNQGHAPYGSSFADEARTQRRFEDIVRSIRNASYLGIPVLVVHPVQHLPYCEDGVPERLFEMNMEFYNRLKPYCQEYNVKIAVENMWQQPAGLKIDHSTCSRPEEFIRYVDALDSDWFVACLDIGHAALVCEDPAAFIRKLGAKRLKSLHVHDVDGIFDSHTQPYYGIINWDKVTAALGEIGYEGDFTYESGRFLGKVPVPLKLSGARFMADTGRYLIKKIKENSRLPEILN